MKTLFYQLYEVPFVKLSVFPIYKLSIFLQMNDRNLSSRKYTPLNNDPFHKTIIHITTIQKTKSKHTIGISSFYSLSSSHTLTIHSPHDPTHYLKLQLSLYTLFISFIMIETLFSLISTYFFHITNLE